MALNITKKKQAAVEVVTTPVLSELATQIDEIGGLQEKMGKLEREIEQLAGKQIAKLAELSKSCNVKMATLNHHLNAELDKAGVDPDTPAVEKGAKFQAEVGKKGNQRVVTDMQLVENLLETSQPGLFMKLVKINLGDLDDYLTPQEREAVIDTQRTLRKAVVVKRVD
jgi:ABC-type transporter Mla subunit MlaD